MKLISKREALEICAAMWDYIADNSDTLPKTTAAKPIALKAIGVARGFESDCAACEYDVQHGMGECESCPIWKPPFICTNSEYGTWIYEPSESTARAIAALARLRLSELEAD